MKKITDIRNRVIYSLLDKPLSFKELSRKVYPERYTLSSKQRVECLTTDCHHISYKIVPIGNKYDFGDKTCPRCRRKYIRWGVENYRIVNEMDIFPKSKGIAKVHYTNFKDKTLRIMVNERILSMEESNVSIENQVYSLNINGIWKWLSRINKNYEDFITKKFDIKEYPKIVQHIFLIIKIEKDKYKKMKWSKKAKADFYQGNIMQIFNDVFCGIGRQVHQIIMDKSGENIVTLRKKGIAVKTKNGHFIKYNKILQQRFDKETTRFLLNCLRVYRTSVMFFRDMSIDTFFKRSSQDGKIN